MQHQIFEPNKNLQSIIKCYWTLESPKEETPQRNNIVPDGHMKMIFHYGDLYSQYSESGEFNLLPRCFVIGHLTKPLEVGPTGDTGTFFVVFHPHGFLPFATTPIKEMENTAVSLEKLFGKDGQDIEQRILNATNTAERISHIETFLIKQLTDKKNVHHILKSTLETILTANGQLSVGELSKQTNVNRRQLERKFSSDIGLSPKQLLKIIRLQASLKLMLHNDYESLTTIAHDNDYYDQAHFIKDFKEFAGITPKEFYGDRLRMSLIFDKQD